MTHGHELNGGNVGRKQHAGCRGVKGGKGDNCNSIINKMYEKNDPHAYVSSFKHSCFGARYFHGLGDFFEDKYV